MQVQCKFIFCFLKYIYAMENSERKKIALLKFLLFSLFFKEMH